MANKLCPCCDEDPIHDLAWHCFTAHMEPSKYLNASIPGAVRRCWCGIIIDLTTYEKHLKDNDGPFVHYHASMLGVTP